jgi:FkbM family methyltransferase
MTTRFTPRRIARGLRRRARLLLSPEPPPAPATELQTYRGYSQADLEVFARFDVKPPPQPGFVTDFHGGRTRTALLWDGAQHLDGAVLPLPIPADHHAETIEWVGTLRSVLEARGGYSAMEVGAGMGPWLVAAGVAARLLGLAPIRLAGIEADPTRFAAMRQNLADNGFDPDAHMLIQGAAGVRAGIAHWPVRPNTRNDAGLRPLRPGVAEDVAYYDGETGRTMEVRVHALGDLLAREPPWDLLHVDIQGGEAELCAGAIDMITKHVRRLVVATHSRVLDGAVMATMRGAGWRLEAEKPTRFIPDDDVASLERMTTHDGTQVWRNRHL